MRDLTVLHTNDLHGKLPPWVAERIIREKSSVGPSLLLDAGDSVSSGNVYFRPGGEPILVRMSDLGYDAMAMGNREFHFLAAGLKSKVKLACFPILSANIRSEACEIGPSVLPYTSFDLDGLRVTVFGLTVPMITKRMLVSKLSPFWFDAPVVAAAGIVPRLRDQADILIGVTHIGLQADEELAASVPGIDLIVGGHTHAVLAEPKMVGDTAVVHAGWYGRYLGKVEIALPATGRRPHVKGQLIDLRRPE